MSTNNVIDYVEFAVSDMQVTKDFYAQVFGWTFADWGETYVSFSGAGIEGGFDSSGERKPGGGTMIVINHDDLVAKKDQIEKVGGTITKDIFSFPGGERFEFHDPSGNALALWRKL